MKEKIKETKVKQEMVLEYLSALELSIDNPYLTDEYKRHIMSCVEEFCLSTETFLKHLSSTDFCQQD